MTSQNNEMISLEWTKRATQLNLRFVRKEPTPNPWDDEDKILLRKDDRFVVLAGSLLCHFFIVID